MLVKSSFIFGSLVLAAAISVSSAGAAPAGLASERQHPAAGGRLVQEAYGGYPSQGWYSPHHRRHEYGLGYRSGYDRGHHHHWHHWRAWRRYHDDRGWWRDRDYRRCMIEPWLCRRGY
jgi:hypothetical protein